MIEVIFWMAVVWWTLLLVNYIYYRKVYLMTHDSAMSVIERKFYGT